MSNERRRDKRLAIELPAVVKVGKKPHAGTTSNVSFHGMSVRLEDAPPVRQLVQVELDLPGDKKFSAHMMVVHTAPGVVGLEFFGRSNNPDWDEFVQGVQRQSPSTNPSLSAPPPAPRLSAPPAGGLQAPLAAHQLGTNPVLLSAPTVGRAPSGGPPAPYSGPERRRAPRIAMTLELRLRTSRSIHSAYTSDVSMLGATVLVTDFNIPVGEPLILNLIQPGTNFSFRRDGVLKRARPVEAPWTQVGVEFSALEQMREMLFAEFMNAAYAALNK